MCIKKNFLSFGLHTIQPLVLGNRKNITYPFCGFILLLKRGINCSIEQRIKIVTLRE